VIVWKRLTDTSRLESDACGERSIVPGGKLFVESASEVSAVGEVTFHVLM
jgi:hypothetical protein